MGKRYFVGLILSMLFAVVVWHSSVSGTGTSVADQEIWWPDSAVAASNPPTQEFISVARLEQTQFLNRISEDLEVQVWISGFNYYEPCGEYEYFCSVVYAQYIPAADTWLLYSEYIDEVITKANSEQGFADAKVVDTTVSNGVITVTVEKYVGPNAIVWLGFVLILVLGGYTVLFFAVASALS